MKNWVYPNAEKKNLFDLFDKGYFPSDIIALKFTPLTYGTVMVYHHYYKAAKKMRSLLISTVYQRYETLLNNNGSNETVIRHLYKNLDDLLYQIPLPWFYKPKKGVDELIEEILQRWEPPLDLRGFTQTMDSFIESVKSQT